MIEKYDIPIALHALGGIVCFINRSAIGDRDNLTYNANGSLDIYIQHDSPGLDKESNWLPAPRGPLSIIMRLYSPRREALDGTWSPPPVKKVQ